MIDYQVYEPGNWVGSPFGPPCWFVEAIGRSIEETESISFVHFQAKGSTEGNASFKIQKLTI